MNIAFKCQFCGKGIRTDKANSGRQASCPHCGQMLTIPAAQAPPRVQPPQSRAQAWAAQRSRLPHNPQRQRTAIDYRARREEAALQAGTLDNYARRFGLIWGILIVVASLMPVLVPTFIWGAGSSTKAVFPLFEDVGSLGHLVLIYVLLAGVAAIALSLATSSYASGISLLSIGGAFLVFLLVGPSELETDLFGSLNAGKLISAATAISVLGLYTGLRIQRAAPESPFARILAGVCAILGFLLLVMPILPENQLFLVVPFKMMEIKQLAADGFLMILVMAVLITAGVFGCLGFQANASRNRALGTIGSLMLLITLISAPVCLVLIALGNGGGLMGNDGILPFVLMVFKVEGAGYGMCALVVIGAIELFNATQQAHATAGDDVEYDTAQNAV